MLTETPLTQDPPRISEREDREEEDLSRDGVRPRFKGKIVYRLVTELAQIPRKKVIIQYLQTKNMSEKYYMGERRCLNSSEISGSVK